MPWDRQSLEEYDDGYTRESFERAEEDTEESLRDPADAIYCAIRLLEEHGYTITKE